jgi:hypothetical protein
MTYKLVKDNQRRPVKSFTFDRATCKTCPLFTRCVHSQTQGRTVTLHYHAAPVHRDSGERRPRADAGL